MLRRHHGPLLRDLCTRMPEREWWAASDLAQRLVLVVGLFTYHMLTSPLSFGLFAWRKHRLYHGRLISALLTIMYPLTPVAMLAAAVKRELSAALSRLRSGAPDEKGREDVLIWLIRPPGALASCLWTWYLSLGWYTAIFTQLGCAHPTAIRCHWLEEVNTKTFWRRSVFEPEGIACPRAVGRWDGAALKLDQAAFDAVRSSGGDLYLKYDDAMGYEGNGDRLLVHGTDWSTAADVARALGDDAFRGHPALVLEYVRAHPELGTHSIDIVTVRTAGPDGAPRYDAVCVALWAACTGPSSHAATEGYVVDPCTETVTAPTRWYSAWFHDQAGTLVGRKLDGIRDACRAAERAHARTATMRPWMSSVGWDLVLTPRGAVFFEGNLGGWRLPRRIYASAAHLRAFLPAFESGHRFVAARPAPAPAG